MRVEALERREVLSGSGLIGQYFHNENFTGLAAERTEAVDFNWGSGSPVAGLDGDTFSARWTGQVEAVYSETYTFYTTSNQGVRLWVNGDLIIDNWEPHNTEEDSATIDFVAGQRYDLRLDYYEQFGGAQMRMEWASPSQAREVIPAARLYAGPTGLFGEYTDAFGGVGTRVDATIDFDWGIGRPHPTVAVDQVDVRWTGQIRAGYSEEYTFSIESDDGARLWIGEELVVDDWESPGTSVATGTKTLEAGKWYDLRLEYFDDTGNAEVSLSWSSARQTGAGVFEVVPTESLRASKAAREQFRNPLGAGQDPFVIYADDRYFHVRSEGNSIFIDSAEALQDIHSSDPASNTALAWTAPPGTDYSEQIWAPELHRLEGKWYIYVAASDGNNATHRMHVLERDDPSPMGSYVYRGELTTNSDRWAIDGTVLQWQGQLYFLWSGWPGPVNGQQNLYIAEMSDPLTISSNRVLISSPTFAWEQHGLPINEGPQILIHDGSLHVIYSASGYWRPEYALGRLTYDGVGSLLDPASWQKSPTPVFQQAGGIVGTGHASFTTSPDGTEHWIVYHAHRNPNVFQEDREIRLQRFVFADDGTPDFGSPLPSTTLLPAPSGSEDPERPFVTGDFDASGAVDPGDHAVWASSFGQSAFPGVSADGNGDGVVNAADYTLYRDNVQQVEPPVDPTVAYWRHEEGASGGLIPSGSDAVLDSSGSANHMRTFDPAFTSASYTSSVSPLPLRSGLPNTLSLDFGPGGDDFGLNDDNFSQGKPINSQLFDELTVELAFRMDSIGGFQALVGKDGAPVASPVPPLKIVVRGDDFPNGIDNQLFVEWIDGDGDIHFLAGGTTVAAGEWNHVAFTLTASTAELYVAGETGPYQLVDAVSNADFARAAGEVLFDSPANFTVGRGAFADTPADWTDAHIDEVRISDRALQASEFVFDPSPFTSQSLSSGRSRYAPTAPVGDPAEARSTIPALAPLTLGDAASSPTEGVEQTQEISAVALDEGLRLLLAEDLLSAAEGNTDRFDGSIARAGDTPESDTLTGLAPVKATLESDLSNDGVSRDRIV